MKTILVPLDGSPIAQQVLPYAELLAPLMSARIRLLCAVSDFEPETMRAALFESLNRGVPLPGALTWTQALRQRVETYLDVQAERLRAAGLDVEVVIREGQPADIVVEAAEAADVELILMGTHGYSGFRRWALGSITDKVVHAAPKPVLVVRAVDTPPAVPPTLRRVLVPLDGSPLARAALPAAIDLAGRAHAELLLLTTVAPPLDEAPWDAQPVASEDELLAAVRAQLLEETHAVAAQLAVTHVAVTPIAVPGLPRDAILGEAVRRNVDLIVMATHGYGGLRRWVLGSVADKVLHGATVPLLLVRPLADVAADHAAEVSKLEQIG